MSTFKVYYEQADSDNEKVYKGTVDAATVGEAIQQAAQFLEVPSHDIVVKRVVHSKYVCPSCHDQGCYLCMDSSQIQM